tara:strand:+ start:50 stop:220 length:171 start_codon:yes stop_codon:yes gene_type:complete
MIAKTIIIFLMTLGLGLGIAYHGKDRKPSNGWYSLIRFLLWFTLLYCAGFFDGFLF